LTRAPRLSEAQRARPARTLQDLDRGFDSNPRLILKPDFNGLGLGVSGKAIG
jgi:hypothetical protein